MRHSPNKEDWNASLARLGGDLLQSWDWGVFKEGHGWKAERVWTEGPAGDEMAQILFRPWGGFSMAYIPRGPAIADPTADGIDLLAKIDEVCSRNRAITLFIEPHRLLPASWQIAKYEFDRGPAQFQAARTVRVALASDDELLAQMRRDTRYNISRAQRDEVVVVTRVGRRRSGRYLLPAAGRNSGSQQLPDSCSLLLSGLSADIWRPGRSSLFGSRRGGYCRPDCRAVRA